MNHTHAESEAIVIRPRRAIWVASVCALALIVAFVAVAIVLRRSNTGVVFHVADQVAMIGIGLLLAAGAMLFALPRVQADRSGIVVRNIVLSRRFAWNEVLSISFPEGAAWARLELPDEEYYSLLAIQAVDRMHAVHAVRALRRLHRQAAETGNDRWG